MTLNRSRRNIGNPKKDKKSSQARASLLTRLIPWFESYVELYTIDPVRIERSLKGYAGSDIAQVWNSVKPEVEKMNDLPSSSPRIARYAKLSSRARAVSIFLTVGVFASLLIFLNFEKSLSSAGGFSLLEIVPLAVIAIMYAVIMLSVLSTRRLNKVMRAFYLEHSHELGKQKAHLREATQLLIEKLQREIYSHNYEPNNYKFQLFNTNYRHINVVGTHGAKSVVMIKPKTVSFSSASKHSDAHSVATSSPSTTRKR